MKREIRNLIHEKGGRIREVSYPPIKSDGQDGDARMYDEDLYIKTKGNWVKIMSGDKIINQEITRNIDNILSEGAVTHGGLTGVTANQHHNQGHSIDGADHTGILTVAKGGTGLDTVAADRLLTGNGTGALTAEANLVYTSAGLGVGTTSPNKAGNTSTDTILTVGDGAAKGYEGIIELIGHGDDDADGDVGLGAIQFLDMSNSLEAHKITSMITGESWDGGSTPDQQGGKLHFWTKNEASTPNGIRMTILGNGYVGIGTAAPDSLLEVSADGTDMIKITNTANGVEGALVTGTDQAQVGTITNDHLSFICNNTTKMMLLSTGELGLGTLAPQDNLHITQNPGNSVIIVESFADAEGTTSYLRLDKARGTEAASLANKEVDDNHVLGVVQFRGHDGAGTDSYLSGAEIIARVNGNVTTNVLPTDLEFWTNDGASGATQRMTITEAGNVGIGTNAPTQLLHLKSTDPRIYMEDSTSDGSTYKAKFGLINSVFTVSVNDGAIDALVIDSAGKVGIGTTAPDKTLEINSGANDNNHIRLSYNDADGSASVYSDISCTSGGNLVLAPTGDITLSPTGNDVLPNTSYAVNLGSAGKKYLSLRCVELRVDTLVAADVMSTIGGRILVGPTTELIGHLAANTGETTIQVKHNNLSNGDIVMLEGGGNFEAIKLGSGPSAITGGYEHTGSTRNFDGSGVNVWTEGDAVFNTGNVGDSWIDIYSEHAVNVGANAGPTIVGNVRSAIDAFSSYEPMWALGNLDGYYGLGDNQPGVAIGKYSSEHLLIQANSIKFRDAGATKMEMDSGGDIVMYANDGTTITSQWNDQLITLGITDNEHIKITDSSFEIKDSTTVLASYGATTTIGQTGAEHVSISSSGIELKDNTTVLASMVGTTTTLGYHGTTKIVLDGSAGTMAVGSKFSVNSSGDVSVTDVNLGSRINTTNTDNNNIVIGSGNLAHSDWDSGIDGTDKLSDNVIIGSNAAKDVEVDLSETFLKNVAIGFNAMRDCNPDSGGNDADGNVAIGWSAMQGRDIGNNNVAIGKGAMISVSGTADGEGNVAIGESSLSDITTGDNNVCIGRQAGDNITSGHNNVVIGGADVTAGSDNQLSISSGDASVTWITGNSTGDITVGHDILMANESFIGIDGGERIIFDTSGSVRAYGGDFGINCDPNYRFECKETADTADYMARFWHDGGETDSHGIIIQCGHNSGSTSESYDGTTMIRFNDGNGDAFGYILGNDADTVSDGANYLYISDERLKKDIVDTSLNGLETINKVKLRDFTWKKSGQQVKCGLIAQEVHEAYEGAARKRKNEVNSNTQEKQYKEYLDDDYLWTASNEALILPLIKAVQELSAKVTALEAQIN